MSTHSTISIENLDGSINTIYCHYDGYISHNGVILQTKYTDREYVAKLIMGGAISTLGSSISPVPLDFDEPTAYTKYYSYRGGVTSIDYYKDFDDYEQNHQYEEFEYLFTKDNVWSVFYRGDWHDLEYVIQESEKEVA